ncbi:TolC family protein [Novosphingobium sp. PASSN1]|uniref:TolC family protein n=1 Tax=Novosphingobium sp. PASSN1 TaxID=2015561 RepID=UPI000BCDD2F5|nr:TolC family protein [Novosphingobium sp. PASSN1]OYU37009.1 MAG: transporter [Novosphingobium sp. PASSN1]
MNRHLRIAVLSALILPGLAAAQTIPLDQRADLPPAPLVSEALDSYPGVLSAAARIDAARAQADALAHGPQEISVQATALRRSVDREGQFAEFDATITRPLRLPGKARIDRKTGAAGVLFAQNQMADARHQAALTLSQQWFDWVEAGALAASDTANISYLERALGAVERRAALRDAAALDVDQARAALSRARGQRADALARAAEARARLAATFPTIPLPADPPAPTTPSEPQPGFPALAKLVVERSHEVAAAQAMTDREGFAAERARAERRADPSLGLRAFSERGGMERGLGVVATLPLGGGYRRLQADEAAANARAATQDLAVVQRSVAATAAADRALAEARLIGWHALAQSAAAAGMVADRTVTGGKLGAIDLADVLLAQRQANDARREEITARIAALRAILKLEIDSHVVWIDADDHPAPAE